jgi:hypothetical protein
MYSDRDLYEVYKQQENCACGSSDVCAWSSIEGPMCEPCWKDYQREKAERKAKREAEARRSA